MILPRHSLSLCALLLPCVGLAAQRGRAPVQIDPALQDGGVPVEMFESSNLDNFLRRAQDALGKGEFSLAIRALQDVIEGRTGEFKHDSPAGQVGEGQPAKQPGNAASAKGKPKPPGKAPKDSGPATIDEDNPAYSVFSSDQRIYRPVTRLCHELLASMPMEGLGLYRSMYESRAQAGYEKALAAQDLSQLQDVSSKYFATVAAGRAMVAGCDLLMDQGRFRSAIQLLRQLLEVYPEASRKEGGIHDLDLLIKFAICYQQLGDLDLAKAKLEETVGLFPEASVRLMGELFTVKDLHGTELFDVRSLVQAPRQVDRNATLDIGPGAAPVSLWEFRYTAAKPYESKVRKSSRRVSYISRTGSGARATTVPKHNNLIPGTVATFRGSKLLFMDGYRLLVHDLNSGRQVKAPGDAAYAEMRTVTTPVAARTRVPAYDYFATRVATTTNRYYVIQAECTSSTSKLQPVLENELAAYEVGTGRQVWRLLSKTLSRRGFTFLATPVVFRDMLLMPFLEGGSYGLLALRQEDHSEVFRTYLHSAGTAYARAPAPQVVVRAGIAYCLTNAGVLGAVDAYSGVLQWSRRYERVHPRWGRVIRRPKSSNRGFFGNRSRISEKSFTAGFRPGNLFVQGDLVILAASDSKVLLCLDGATGDVVWNHHAEAQLTLGDYEYIVGVDQDAVYVVLHNTNARQLMRIGLRSGMRQWLVDIPGSQDEWMGRGYLAGGQVFLPGRPGARELHVVEVGDAKRGRLHTIKLPAFSIGKEPLSGPCNLFVGPHHIALTYQSGLEVFSTAEALASLADDASDPTARAGYLVHAGKLGLAAEILLKQLTGKELQGAARERVAIRLLSLAGEATQVLAKNGRRKDALQLLDRCRRVIQTSRLKRRVHLLRLQLFRALGDVAGIEREQEIIESGLIK